MGLRQDIETIAEVVAAYCVDTHDTAGESSENKAAHDAWNRIVAYLNIATEPDEDPKWLQVAARELGVQEIAGAGDNPRIVEYLRATKLPASMLHDSTAWCAGFVSWVLTQAGMQSPHTASARDYLSYGTKLDAPRKGCVVVYERPEAGPNAGHVAFYLNSISTTQHAALGGNQNNRVCVETRPNARVLGYRWPA